MNRLAGIIVAAVGFVVCILGITQVLPGMTSTGVVMILLGGLIIGLSFIDKPSDPEVERMSTASTLGNIFFSPTEVFKNLRSHPRWLVALIIMTVLSATYSNLFLYRLTPERVANFTVDKTLEMPMIAGSEDARKSVEAGRADAIDNLKNPIRKAGNAMSGFASSVFGYAFLALIFFLFALAMGGKLGWWQAFSATIYAAFPFIVIRTLLNGIVLFIKEPDDVHPILGQSSLIQDNLNFLVAAKDNPVIFSFLGGLSLLGFYWVWLNATGLKNAGDKVSGTIAWTSSITVYVLIILLVMAMATFFPSFIS
jgi:hypothetical protein